MLVNIKKTPQVYAGDTSKQPFKGWRNEMIAYCNGVKEGLMTMMEWAEKQEGGIGPPELIATDWEFAIVSDQKLYDSLV